MGIDYINTQFLLCNTLYLYSNIWYNIGNISKGGGYMVVKRVFEEANRYEEVVNLLTKISELNHMSYAIRPVIDGEGNVTRSLSGGCISREAKRLLELIVQGATLRSIVSESDADGFENLRKYISNETDVLLHNYAIHLSHGCNPTMDIDTIRVWLILNNFFFCINMEGVRWSIPKTWERVDD